MSNLKISTKSKQKSAPVADSWDDDDDEASSDDDMATPTTPTRAASPPKVPPPTPASPFQSNVRDRAAQLPQFSFEGGPGENPGLAFTNNMAGDSRDRRRGDDVRRPEKSAAAASRLIAGALGIRAPKMTAEQREYEKAIKEKEKNRRTEEKQRKEQEEKGRLAAWED